MPGSDGAGRAPTNRLLAALPPRAYGRLRPYCEPVFLSFRQVLQHPHSPIPYVYFPLGGVVSVVIPPDGPGDGVEVGLVGREGVVGLPVLLGADSSPARWLVQIAGQALRMPAREFRAHGARPPLRDLLLLYANAYLAQVSQAVACNGLHSVQERLCHWLLMVHSRAESDEFPLTHEFLAAMLGVRRAGVTVAARGLRKMGLIRYGRGRLQVLDRPGLQSAACRCHRVVQAELDRLPGD